MKSVILPCLLALALFLAPSSGRAEDLLSIGVGAYDANDDEGAADFRLEYRWDVPALKIVRPWAGIEMTADGGFFGAAGLLADIRLSQHTFLSPGIGAGLYKNGGGKKLGNLLEFRTQLELGYAFDSGLRLSVAASHISNGGFGAYNPGTEIVGLYLHLPAAFLFGQSSS